MPQKDIALEGAPFGNKINKKHNGNSAMWHDYVERDSPRKRRYNMLNILKNRQVSN